MEDEQDVANEDDGEMFLASMIHHFLFIVNLIFFYFLATFLKKLEPIMPNIIDIEAAISLQHVVIKCGLCKGAGAVTVCDSTDGISYQCPRCDGKGKLLIEADHLPLIECNQCHGFGTTQPLDKLDRETPTASTNWLAKVLCPACEGCGCQAEIGSWRLVTSYPVTSEPRPTVFLTGLTEPEFQQLLKVNSPTAICYLCHRKEGDLSIAVVDQQRVVCSKLELIHYKHRFAAGTHVWNLCVECAGLLEAWTTG